jgi:membrane protease YdiL (CAAX protease family)
MLICGWLVVVLFTAIGFVLDEINKANPHPLVRRWVALLVYAAIGFAGLYFIYKTKAIWFPHFSY